MDTRFRGYDTLSLANPVAAVAIPITVFVIADTLFAHLGRVYLAAAAPAPADGAQMVAAGRLVAHRADDTIGQSTTAGLPVS